MLCAFMAPLSLGETVSLSRDVLDPIQEGELPDDLAGLFGRCARWFSFGTFRTLGSLKNGCVRMNYELLYYSGAGNTALLSKILDRQLVKRGNHVKRSRLKKDSCGMRREGFDMLGLGFPVHFREAPSLVYDCLSNLEGSGRTMFIFCTKGLYSGNAVRNVASLAVARGFEFRGYLEIIMPGTDGLILYSRKASLTERFLKAIVSRRISEKVNRFVSLLETGCEGKIPSEKVVHNVG